MKTHFPILYRIYPWPNETAGSILVRTAERLKHGSFFRLDTFEMSESFLVQLIKG